MMGATTLPSNARRITANIGMLLFLASWGMMFVTLLFAYGVIRTKSAVWPPLDAAPLPQGLAWLNTAVLAVSSGVLHRGVQRLQRDGHSAFTAHLGATLALGVLFLGLQAMLWQRVHADGITLSGSLYGSWVYLLTIFHAVHIVAGLGVLGALVPGALAQRLYPVHVMRVQLSGMFWHFLGVAWLAIFASLFLL